ncbi:hypothetical protein NSB25_22815 [Acetatifactor muris]|uniref:Uncharacterized protein n=1 Tax=Acetatifactor muris TaxID=879566 RepID=A0A2K4ZL03_9FIRM|nr:hypothetical protein [Acetatifactor muris]MCR2050084.1 hypothetical protein [Acetatifactor muris]SOY31161.1 hypothetical protein AMURIS_03896 [Acetatifactor muris]
MALYDISPAPGFQHGIVNGNLYTIMIICDRKYLKEYNADKKK